MATRRLAFRAKGVNQTADANILSIVVELDVATLLGSAPGTLFAVVAETATAGKLFLRLERFGRASIKNGYLAQYGVDTVNRDLDLRDLYNEEDPFQLAPHYLDAYRAGVAVGTFPASELIHTSLAWAVAWFARERTRLLIAVRAGAARLRHHEDPERSRDALEAIEQVARDTAAEIDEIVGALRDNPTPRG